jgi:hypothetical protein
MSGLEFLVLFLSYEIFDYDVINDNNVGKIIHYLEQEH